MNAFIIQFYDVEKSKQLNRLNLTCVKHGWIRTVSKIDVFIENGKIFKYQNQFLK